MTDLIEDGIRTLLFGIDDVRNLKSRAPILRIIIEGYTVLYCMNGELDYVYCTVALLLSRFLI